MVLRASSAREARCRACRSRAQFHSAPCEQEALEWTVRRLVGLAAWPGLAAPTSSIQQQGPTMGKPGELLLGLPYWMSTMLEGLKGAWALAPYMRECRTSFPLLDAFACCSHASETCCLACFAKPCLWQKDWKQGRLTCSASSADSVTGCWRLSRPSQWPCCCWSAAPAVLPCWWCRPTSRSAQGSEGSGSAGSFEASSRGSASASMGLSPGCSLVDPGAAEPSMSATLASPSLQG